MKEKTKNFLVAPVNKKCSQDEFDEYMNKTNLKIMYQMKS